MSELASNAKKRGDKAEALRWYREAFEKSEGPATRLQWGASYVGALVELAPHDEAAIEAARRPALERGGGAARTRSTSAARARCRRSAPSCRRGTRAARTAPSMARLQGEARRPVRGAGAQRERARDLPGAAQRAGQADAPERRARQPNSLGDARTRGRDRAAPRDRAPDGALRRQRRSSTTSRSAIDAGREVRAGRRIGLGQVDHRAVGARPRRRREHERRDRLRRRRPAQAREPRDARASAAARSR